MYDSGYIPVGIIVRSGPPTIGSMRPAPTTGFLRAEKNPLGNEAFNWMAVDWHDDYAHKGENVARYIKHNRYGKAHGWGLCVETRDVSGADGSSYAAEFDICSDRQGGDVFGIATFYGAQTNTFKSGAHTIADCGHKVAPFVYGRNAVHAGYRFEGQAIEGALSVGHHKHSATRHAVHMGPGVTLRWSSADGFVHKTAWHSLPQAVKLSDLDVVGLIDVEVDGTTLQIPVIRKASE